MPDDDGLARIDSMLADYIPPSHLALVPTPEEAEALGYDPQRYDLFDYDYPPVPRPVTANTWALAQGRSRNVDRSREVEQGLMYILQHELQRRFGGPVTATIYRTDTFTTYVDASNGDLEVRYLMDDDVRYDVLTFRPARIRQRGSEVQVRGDVHAFEYFVYEQRLRDFEPMRPTEFLVELEPQRRIIDLTPIRISFEAAHQVRGYRLNLQILDEVVGFDLTPTPEQVAQVHAAFANVGQAAQRANDILEEFAQAVAEADREAEIARPSAPAPLVRSHLDGQRSPYGPPSRRRAR